VATILPSVEATQATREVAQSESHLKELAAIASIVECCGLEFDPHLARESLLIGSTGAAKPFVRLSRALHDLGVRLVGIELSLHEALNNLQPDTAVVALVPASTKVDDGTSAEATELLVLLERSGRKIRINTGEWLSESELLDRLGLANSKTRRLFGVARPLAPADGLTGPPPDDHGHGDDGHGGGHAHPHPLTRLIGLLRMESRDLWTVIIFALGIGILSLASPITTEALVNNVQGGNQAMIQVVLVLSIVLLIALGLAGVMRALQTWIVELIQRRVFVRVVDDLSYRLPRVCITAFDRHHGPELVNRFFDVLTVQKASAILLLDGVSVFIQATVGLLVLAIWHPWLLTFNIVLVIAFAILIFLLGHGAITANIRESYAKYGVAGWLEEMVRHPTAFKFPAGQEYAQSRADELCREYIHWRQRSFRIVFRQIIFAIALQVLASTLLLGLGGYLVIRNELTLGQLVAAELIIVVLVGGFVKLGKSLESFYDLMAAVDKVGHLVDLPLEKDRGEYLPPSKTPARLDIHHVGFAFREGHHSHTVLHDVNASIRPGERVAIVSSCGGGKSTLLELIYGLREPTSGHIEFDGVDLRDIRLDSLREQVMAVSFDEVFDGTVLENVRLGRPSISLTDVRNALRAVGLLSAVQHLPEGIYTVLNTGGAPLSRSQAQQLMLARAIAGHPRLLLIDGTLDQLDPQVRRQIMPALFDRLAPWTLLIVSYDPEVLAACDRRIEINPKASSNGHCHSGQHTPHSNGSSDRGNHPEEPAR